MSEELYHSIQALITLIERTDFTRSITVKLDLGYSMLGMIIFISLLSLLLGFAIGNRKGG